MPATTNKFQIPYPTGGDPVRDAPQTLQNAMQIIDDYLHEPFILIDGAKYPINGAATPPENWQFAGQKPWFYAAFDIPAPYIPPAGYTFETFVLESSSTTFVCTSELKREQKMITCRFIQTWSNDPKALKLIGWRLVPTSTDPNRLN